MIFKFYTAHHIVEIIYIFYFYSFAIKGEKEKLNNTWLDDGQIGHRQLCTTNIEIILPVLIWICG